MTVWDSMGQIHTRLKYKAGKDKCLKKMKLFNVTEGKEDSQKGGCKSTRSLGSYKTSPFQAEQKLIQKSENNKVIFLDINSRNGPNVTA